MPPENPTTEAPDRSLPDRAVDALVNTVVKHPIASDVVGAAIFFAMAAAFITVAHSHDAPALTIGGVVAAATGFMFLMIAVSAFMYRTAEDRGQGPQ